VVGVTLTLLPIMLFCYLLSALIILCSTHVSFEPGEWGRIAVMFLGSALFFLLFMAMGLFVSTRFRSSITSIIVCLFLWVTFVFIIPNTAVYAARSFLKTDTRENLGFALADLDREFEKKCEEYQKTLPEPDWMMHWNMNSMGDGFLELAGSSRSMNEWHRQMNIFSEPLRIEYAEKKWALQQAYLNKLDRQRKLAEHLALLSPSEVFQQAVSALCRTDVPSYYRFMDGTRRYREELIGYFRGKKRFESFQYFTRQDPASFMTADEIVKTRTGGRFQTLQEYGEWAKANNSDFTPLWKVEIPGTDNTAFNPLDLSDVPKFRWEPQSLESDVKRSLTDFAGLALGCIVLFYLAFVSFTRYDAR
jgi:hypothetical protein